VRPREARKRNGRQRQVGRLRRLKRRRDDEAKAVADIDYRLLCIRRTLRRRRHWNIIMAPQRCRRLAPLPSPDLPLLLPPTPPDRLKGRRRARRARKRDGHSSTSAAGRRIPTGSTEQRYQLSANSRDGVRQQLLMCKHKFQVLKHSGILFRKTER